MLFIYVVHSIIIIIKVNSKNRVEQALNLDFCIANFWHSDIFGFVLYFIFYSQISRILTRYLLNIKTSKLSKYT